MTNINQEVTREYEAAYRGKKPTKAEIYHNLLDIAQSKSVQNPKAIAQMLRYFTPAAPKIATTPFDWLCKFVNTDKKDGREYLRFIYADELRAYATNGHILAVTPISLVPEISNGPGYYIADKTAAKSELAATFPNCEKFIEDSAKKCNCVLKEIPAAEIHSTPVNKAIRVYRLHDTLAVQANYLDIATNGDPESVISYDSVNLERGFVLVKHSFGTAIVMPYMA